MCVGEQPSSIGSRVLGRQEREKPCGQTTTAGHCRDLSFLRGVEAGFSIREREAEQLWSWRTCRRGETCWDEQRGDAGVGLVSLGASGLGLV